jgi:hypothetical protein
MPAVVVVGECENLDASMQDGVADLDPFLDVARAIHDLCVPGLRQFLDALAITEPADAGEIGANEVEVFGKLPRAHHPRLVGERESDVVLLKRISELGVF